jgi:endoglucanase
MPTPLVLANDQAAINGIRASGARNLILAPGNGYTGGHAWNESSQKDEPSANYMGDLSDPLNNTAIDIHEYLDVDFSGQHQVCNQSFPANLNFLTSWLKENNLKALVSEFGGDNNTMCDQYLTQAIEYMAANDEYIGWSAWAAGPLWGTNAPCCNDGASLGSLEPGSIAGGGGPSLYYTVWEKVIQPLVPKGLQREGLSSVNGPYGP